MTEYRSIACDVYDVLEVAAMRHKTLQLRLGNRTVEATISDVFARGKEEFLSGIDTANGKHFELRLDSITEVFDPQDNTTYRPLQC